MGYDRASKNFNRSTISGRKSFMICVHVHMIHQLDQSSRKSCSLSLCSLDHNLLRAHKLSLFAIVLFAFWKWGSPQYSLRTSDIRGYLGCVFLWYLKFSFIITIVSHFWFLKTFNRYALLIQTALHWAGTILPL